ncbi:MAG: hypothetical protein PHU46_06595 [Rhodocyclaceae bacterium]|nr:hypothetical protein [Rhodocyclaceae bacterium]
MLIKYNILAAVGAVVGILNTILTWKLFGASQEADVWLLGLAVMNTLSMLVLVGVDQFLVFYTGILTKRSDEAGLFVSFSAGWALLSGVAFALVCLAAADLVVSWFGDGLSPNTKFSAVSVLTLLLPQVAAAPLVHVARCALNAHGKYGRSYALSLIAPGILLLALLYFVAAGGGGALPLGWTSAAAAAVQLTACGIMLRPWYAPWRGPVPADFRALVANSVGMRIGHSFHNFMFGLILNNALSHLAPGMISIFQYAKRFADGVSSVTVGPQNNIYHARQAQAWATHDLHRFRANVKSFLTITSPLFVSAAILTVVCMPWLLGLLSQAEDANTVYTIKTTFTVLMVWQAIVAVETIFVGVVVTSRQSAVLICVNGVFVGLFYTAVQFMAPGHPVWYIALSVAAVQATSLVGFAAAAAVLVRKHFSSTVRIQR